MGLKLFVVDQAGAEVSADIRRDCEFELEMEQPLLSTDRVPVPYSTEISFPPSDTNKRLFGYLPVMRLSPQRKNVQARIVLDGYTLATGSLEYAGIDEDGFLRYSFSGKDIDDIWNRKIWNITDELDEEVNEETHGLGISGYTFSRWMGFPVLVSADATTEVYADAVYHYGTITDPGVKYRNYRNKSGHDYTKTTPCIYVGIIIGQAARRLEIDEDLWRLLGEIAVLGIYKNTESYGGHDDQSGTYLNARGWFKMLPDITILDLTREIMKMFGAAMFLDADVFRVLSFDDILASGTVDWQAKVSKIFSSEPEPAKRYRFKYANSDSAGSPSGGSLSLSGIIDRILSDSGNYNSYKAATGDSYSGRKYSGYAGMIECDITAHYIGSHGAEENEDDEREVFDQSVGLNLVRCIPETLYEHSASGGIDKIVAPVISFVSPDQQRGADVYIGAIGEGQMCDKGRVIKDSADVSGGYDLSAGNLFERFHKDLAAWIEKDRDIVSAELDLSPAELSSFRMWNKVRFDGRDWLIRKLTATISANGSMDVRAEFVSL